MDTATLRQAMAPTSVSDATLTAYLPHYLEAMRAAEITTVRRAAAFAAQIGHESAGLRYMAEIATDGPDWNEDRRRYRGRGPIQLTWSSNYRKFGLWCQAQGYVTDSETFVRNPELVEQPRWGFLAASWYWMRGGPKPGQINAFADAGNVLAVSRCINGWFPDREPNGYADRKARWNRCLAIGDALLGGAVPDNRPDFNEWPRWSSNNSSRNGAKIDAFLIHTQEGGGGDSAAEDLAKWMEGNQVSYHYTISQASDGGVTVVDIVDTDYASWSVLSANGRSINLCFAGSRAAWTRDQWMKQANAIDVAAYLAVQDCRKYGIDVKVIAPPYTGRLPGISDHRYVTQILKDGTHTDVGDNFPWDVFTAAVKKYAGETPTEPAPTTPDYAKETWDQLRIEWPQLGGRTLVDAVGAIGQKLGVAGCYDVKAAK